MKKCLTLFLLILCSCNLQNIESNQILKTYSGNEFPADGFNDFDPTRLKEYEVSHSVLHVLGKLNSVGTIENKIIFSSAAKNPKNADWISVIISSDGSHIENSVVEWSRNGITLWGNQPNTIIKNNIINNTFWGAISSDKSSAKILNNEIIRAGHEGVDVQGGNPLIKNNKISKSRTGIVIIDGSSIIENNELIDVGKGIYVKEGANPQIKDNIIEEINEKSIFWFYDDFNYSII